MEEKAFRVSLHKNPIITMKVITGHFTTSHAHVSHYLDVSDMKSNALIARDVARELAIPYLTSTMVETIVCMERTEVVGAYLAEELLQEGMSVVNSSGVIHVVTPINSHNRTLVFQDSTIEWISNRNILLLVASLSSGRTVKSALDCLEYYNGNVVGISSLFLASHEKQVKEVHALFTSEDVQDYRLYSSSECEMCAAGKKLDAIISSEGYTKI
jgi:orotate phosphoribosyltransferase